MLISFKNITIILTLALLAISCSKEEEREGCTDFTAVNYNYLAKVDDGSCEYLDSTIIVWENGELGYWEDEFRGAFEANACYTDTSTIFLNPDTTITPADTIYNPTDTVYVPADTTINGDVYLLVNSDSEGKYGLIIQLINKHYGIDFKNGYLIFDVQLHPDAYDIWPEFGVFINGNYQNSSGSNCISYRQSEPIQISTSSIDTSSFNEIVIPLIDFNRRHMKSIDLLFGIKGHDAPPYTNLLLIDKIRWVTRLEGE